MPILVAPVADTGSTVWLGSLWLNSAVDPSDCVTFPTMASLSVTTGQEGEVRMNGSGRRRLVLQPGRPRTAEADLPGCSRDQVDWLEAHVADLVCVRDDRGRKFYATYLSVQVAEWMAQTDLANASISLSEVSHSEAV